MLKYSGATLYRIFDISKKYFGRRKNMMVTVVFTLRILQFILIHRLADNSRNRVNYLSVPTISTTSTTVYSPDNRSVVFW
ncbi:MAG: hypothetical protein JST20_03350 [Bacteroidetes bacterium]|nr:hypothetical protein [Bacteroidota bacterium]